MIEAIKHSIVQLQISKEGLAEPVMNGHVHDQPLITDGANFGHFSGSPRTDDQLAASAEESVPETSYSSSEDEEFFDAEGEGKNDSKTKNNDEGGETSSVTSHKPTVISTEED